MSDRRFAPQLREIVRRVPGLGRALASLPLPGGAKTTADYWERRYAAGGDSGHGSYGELAEFKAEFLNRFVAEHAVARVLEFGCGDGNQLALARYPEYIGLDVSQSAIERSAARFAGDPTRAFYAYSPSAFHDALGLFRADLAMSLDVLYHLVEDEVFELHIAHLFAAARRFVVIYSSDVDRRVSAHVRHRHFTRSLERLQPGWRLRERVANPLPKSEVGGAGSEADFFVYERREPTL